MTGYTNLMPRVRFTPRTGGYVGAGHIYEIELNGAIGSLGKKRKGLFKKMIHVQQVVRRKVEPKFMRKAMGKVFNKENFKRFAPVLAGLAQVLNIIPGLGVAVGLAIMAGAAAITLTASLMAKHDAKVAAKKEEVAAEAQANADATAKADAAFDQSGGYFTETYGVTKAQFTAMPLEKKMQFLQQAVLDQQQEEQTGGLLVEGLVAAGLIYLLFLRKKR